MSYDYFNLSIRDANGSVLASSSTGGDTTVSATAGTAGTYYVRIIPVGRWSDDKYELKVSTTAGLGDVEIEPNNSQQEATDLGNEALTDNYFPRMTKIITKISVQEKGLITVFFDPTISSSYDYFYVAIRNSSGKALSRIQSGNTEEVKAYVENAGDYYIVKVESTNRYDSDNYTVKYSFSPGTAYREIEDNWNVDNATSLIQGVFYTGQLISTVDGDFYSFTVDQPGMINLEFRTFDSSTDYYNIGIRDSSGNILSATNSGKDTTLSATAKNAGTYTF